MTGDAVAEVYSRGLRRCGFQAKVEAMHDAGKRGDRNAAVQHLADHMVDVLGLIGSDAECRAKVDAFVAAGVDMPMILLFTPEFDPAPAHERTSAAFWAPSSG